ncbi:MAG: hypothetical protein EHM35_01065 [Planctomycetaceae bacterium]|nr:MAG: hypothetical protein EHM35_01065 [Planctomycetaceae bacterium]
MPKIDWPAIDKAGQAQAKRWEAVPQFAAELTECLKYQAYLREQANDGHPVPRDARKQFSPSVQLAADRWLATLGLKHAQEAAQLTEEILEVARLARERQKASSKANKS